MSWRLELPALSPAWMARTLGVLYASGATLALVWTLLPHDDHAGDGVVVAMAVLALAMGLTMALGPTNRLPMWSFHVVIALIQLVISIAYVAVGSPGNDIGLFYAWATPYAAFFFGRRAAIAHSVWTCACLTGSLVLMDTQPAVALRVWLMTTGLIVAVGSLVGIVATRMRASQTLLHHAAMHDPLTGLVNRRGFADVLEDAIVRRNAQDGRVVVLLVDLDRFKLVNDTYGHHVGDQLLVQVAPRLLAAVRTGDLVARMGGDEFAVVCEDATGTLDIAALVERLRTAWVEPVALERGDLPVSGSVGVALCSSPADTAESLLRDADVALYRAKAVERGSAVVYDASMRADLGRRAALDHALRGALARGELDLVFQPVVDLATGQPVAAEALLRWTSADLGVVPPAEFVPVAEDLGLIRDIGAWCLEQACELLAGWRRDGLVGPDFAVAINVSGRQLRPGFAAVVADAAARHGLPAGVLHLEITESVLLDDSRATADSLAELHSLGTPLLLDDFGTGYSSMSYLERLPISGLKIDKSFVADVHASPRRRTLVAAMLTMADGLGLGVVAEGVDSNDVAETLRDLGCRRAQGDLWAKPEDTIRFATRLAALDHAVARAEPA